MKIIGAALAAALAVLANLAFAEDVGKHEYLTYCATCHGADGTGTGPLAASLTIPVPDLTIIASSNDGDFLFGEIVRVVDGRSGIMGHGATMPVWGDRFLVSATSQRGETAEMVTRGRILSLVYYLESIQVK